MASQLSMPTKGDMIAIMKTNRGTIKFKLFPNECPKTSRHMPRTATMRELFFTVLSTTL